MRFSRKKSDHVLVIGIFQNPEVGRAVLRNLHRARFRRSAAIQASAKRRPQVRECGVSAIAGAAVAAVLGLGLGAFISWQREMLAEQSPGVLWLWLPGFALAGALA